MVSEQDLTSNGISVAAPLPHKIPVVRYPTFKQETHSLLKKHLSRNVWSSLKRKKTAKGGSIQLCIESGSKQLLSDKIGFLACDDEAYNVFNELTEPLIADLHPNYDFKCTYKFETLNLAGI